MKSKKQKHQETIKKRTKNQHPYNRQSRKKSQSVHTTWII
jgi:hypothetical protein